MPAPPLIQTATDRTVKQPRTDGSISAFSLFLTSRAETASERQKNGQRMTPRWAHIRISGPGTRKTERQDHIGATHHPLRRKYFALSMQPGYLYGRALLFFVYIYCTYSRSVPPHPHTAIHLVSLHPHCKRLPRRKLCGEVSGTGNTEIRTHWALHPPPVHIPAVAWCPL
ncbi:hypothetical protein L211DRAFT_194124 [Terfezia boudieri ATCC MYA-4762]|uniref:Uncharacterized protein n=1 Tax=Terfezia boudieri ATCC MYA-4762 TaxID=1051890 RepID=A0A3N4LS24_9PEZI|nr:hypothetical protein L211DRAFT_194124 [Terfezia boudieri ATCC MYA-4762]